VAQDIAKNVSAARGHRTAGRDQQGARLAGGDYKQWGLARRLGVAAARRTLWRSWARAHGRLLTNNWNYGADDKVHERLMYRKSSGWNAIQVGKPGKYDR